MNEDQVNELMVRLSGQTEFNIQTVEKEGRLCVHGCVPIIHCLPGDVQKVASLALAFALVLGRITRGATKIPPEVEEHSRKLSRDLLMAASPRLSIGLTALVMSNIGVDSIFNALFQLPTQELEEEDKG